MKKTINVNDPQVILDKRLYEIIKESNTITRKELDEKLGLRTQMQVSVVSARLKVLKAGHLIHSFFDKVSTVTFWANTHQTNMVPDEVEFEEHPMAAFIMSATTVDKEEPEQVDSVAENTAEDTAEEIKEDAGEGSVQPTVLDGLPIGNVVAGSIDDRIAQYVLSVGKPIRKEDVVDWFGRGKVGAMRLGYLWRKGVLNKTIAGTQELYWHHSIQLPPDFNYAPIQRPQIPMGRRMKSMNSKVQPVTAAQIAQYQAELQAIAAQQASVPNPNKVVNIQPEPPNDSTLVYSAHQKDFLIDFVVGLPETENDERVLQSVRIVKARPIGEGGKMEISLTPSEWQLLTSMGSSVMGEQ